MHTRNTHEDNCRPSNADGSVMLPIMPLFETRSNTPLSDWALSARTGRRSEGRGIFPIPQQIKLHSLDLATPLGVA